MIWVQPKLNLLEAGFEYVRLGYMKGNNQSRTFGEKNGFILTGIETANGQGIVVVMQQNLKLVDESLDSYFVNN